MSANAQEQRQRERLVYGISPSMSDILLRAWGYDLRGEYYDIIQAAALPKDTAVLELATGSGRMASILARTGHEVFSGDLVDEKLPEAKARIGEKSLNLVVFLRLSVEYLPFPTGSVDSIVCLNTLHELDRPDVGLEEILRVHSGVGPLVVGDFNETGFRMMQQLHRLVYRDDHPRGHMPVSAARELLERRYSRINTLATPLNDTVIASVRMTPLGGARANPFN